MGFAYLNLRKKRCGENSIKKYVTKNVLLSVGIDGLNEHWEHSFLKFDSCIKFSKKQIGLLNSSNKAVINTFKMKRYNLMLKNKRKRWFFNNLLINTSQKYIFPFQLALSKLYCCMRNRSQASHMEHRTFRDVNREQYNSA